MADIGSMSVSDNPGLLVQYALSLGFTPDELGGLTYLANVQPGDTYKDVMQRYVDAAATPWTAQDTANWGQSAPAPRNLFPNEGIPQLGYITPLDQIIGPDNPRYNPVSGQTPFTGFNFTPRTTPVPTGTIPTPAPNYTPTTPTTPTTPPPVTPPPTTPPPGTGTTPPPSNGGTGGGVISPSMFGKTAYVPQFVNAQGQFITPYQQPLNPADYPQTPVTSGDWTVYKPGAFVGTPYWMTYGQHSAPFGNLHDQIANAMMGVDILSPSSWNSFATPRNTGTNFAASPSSFAGNPFTAR